MASFGASQRAKNEAIRFALSMGKKPRFADGGAVTGPLLGNDPGRADTRAISVPAGAFVVPADIVSGLPGAQGNSLAGHNALDKLFKSLPLSPDEGPYGATPPKLARASTMPGLGSMHHMERVALDKASGGKVVDHGHEDIPIQAADGEYVVHPTYVKRLGQGNLARGHSILDAFVDEIRKKHIKTLQKLPSTVKDGTK